jgi:hypothetical protein
VIEQLRLKTVLITHHGIAPSVMVYATLISLK